MTTSDDPSSRGANDGPKASEKRRAQNRAAQKTYREKRKRRLHDLETLAKRAGLIGNEDKGSSAAAAAAAEAPREPQKSTSDHVAMSGNISLTYQSEPRIVDLDDFDSMDSLDGIIDDSWFETVSPATTTTTTTNTNTNTNTNSHSNTTTDLMWPTPTTTLSSIPSGANSPFQFTSSASNQRFTSFSPAPSPSDPILYMADPLANTIRMQHLNLFSAFFAISTHLGIPIEHCDTDSDSPFYDPLLATRSSAPDSDSDSESLILAAQSSFSGIKRDLRPTRTQLTVRHPSYLDILPFPDMRDRLIRLVTADPPMLDEDEFWADLENEGIVCWGNIGVAGAGGAGAPWDARSWEAKSWFLTKWNWVVGDAEESELGRSSSWWRSLRGHGQGWSL
jgi:hypothetical protein